MIGQQALDAFAQQPLLFGEVEVHRSAPQGLPRDCFAALTRNKMAQGYDTVQTLPRRKAGAHPSSARQPDRWVPAFAGKALWWRSHRERVGRLGRWPTRNDDLSKGCNLIGISS